MTHLFRAALCLFFALVAGCSGHGRRFAEASRMDVKRLPYEGAYSGRWTSASHPGSGGSLRCILTKLNGTGPDFRADFHATWHGLSSGHSVVLNTKPARPQKPGLVNFEGTSKLDTIIGAGTYACKGAMDDRLIRACYDATYDRGTFEMTRVTTKTDGR